MKNRGFTLIEVMIVVVIIGILAAIAFPSYQRSVLKSQRADGRAAIMDIHLAQEKRRGNCAVYAPAIGASDVCDPITPANDEVVGSSTSTAAFYAVSITAAGGNNYTIQADPQGAQAADTSCDPLTFTVAPASPNGAKGPVGCW